MTDRKHARIISIEHIAHNALALCLVPVAAATSDASTPFACTLYSINSGGGGGVRTIL